MTQQGDFTPAEWEMLGNAVLAACAAVAVAEPGGGAAEAQAILDGWREAQGLFDTSPLILSIITTLDPADRAARERTSGMEARDPEPTFGGILREALVLCSDAASAIARRGSPAEVQEYRTFVLHLAGKVASAAGGTGLLNLGSGGTISERERAVIREISAALSPE